MKVSFDPGTEKWIPWGHARLAEMRKFRARSGAPSFTRAWEPESGVQVWARSASSGDWLRITGGEDAVFAETIIEPRRLYRGSAVQRSVDLDGLGIYITTSRRLETAASTSAPSLHVSRFGRPVQALANTIPGYGAQPLRSTLGIRPHPNSVVSGFSFEGYPDHAQPEKGVWVSEGGLRVTTVYASGLPKVFVLSPAQQAEESELPAASWTSATEFVEESTSATPAPVVEIQARGTENTTVYTPGYDRFRDRPIVVASVFWKHSEVTVEHVSGPDSTTEVKKYFRLWVGVLSLPPGEVEWVLDRAVYDGAAPTHYTWTAAGTLFSGSGAVYLPEDELRPRFYLEEARNLARPMCAAGQALPTVLWLSTRTRAEPNEPANSTPTSGAASDAPASLHSHEGVLVSGLPQTAGGARLILASAARNGVLLRNEEDGVVYWVWRAADGGTFATQAIGALSHFYPQLLSPSGTEVWTSGSAAVAYWREGTNLRRYEAGGDFQVENGEGFWAAEASTSPAAFAWSYEHEAFKLFATTSVGPRHVMVKYDPATAAFQRLKVYSPGSPGGGGPGGSPATQDQGALVQLHNLPAVI